MTEESNESIVHTLKHGKGYEASWDVFRGDAAAIRKSALELYGLGEVDVEGMSTAEVLEAIRLTVQEAGVFKPAVVKAMLAAAKTAVATDEAKTEPVASVVQVETDQGLLEQVKAATDLDSLRALWAANKGKWDATIQRAVDARIKEIKGEDK